MIDLGATNFYIDVPSISRYEFEEYSTNLFDEWDDYVGSVLKVPDYSLALDVEEGSIKGAGRVAVALGALYLGIGQYGSFISGLQTIQGQVRYLSDFLVANAVSPFSSKEIRPKVKRYGGALGGLRRLFVKVQQGHLTAEQAMSEAEVLFGAEAESSPEFMKALELSLEETPLMALQLSLPLDGLNDDEIVQVDEKKQRRRSLRSRPEVPIGQQFRVEIWRESKKEKRKVRVTQL